MNIKTKILLVAFGLGIIGLVIFAFSNQKKPEKVQPLVPAPNIPKTYNKELPLKNVTGDFNLPNSLEVFNLKYKYIDKNYATSVAKNFDFASKLNEINDVTEGTKYYISDQTRSLWITPSTNLIKYNLINFPPNVKNEDMSEVVIKDIAERFLKEKLNLNTSQLKVLKVEYLTKPNNYNDSQFTPAINSKFDIARVTFTMKDSQYPLYSSKYLQPAIFIDILSDGNVYQASVVAIDSYTNYSNINLKNLDEINSTLKQSSLQELEGYYISVPNAGPKSIDEININSIDVIYLIDQKHNVIVQPVYLLVGSAKTSDTPEAKDVKLLLPAAKN